MSEETKDNLMTIAKNSSMSIGLSVTLAIFLFYGARTLGRMETEMRFHEQKEMHDGALELFVPKSEVDLQFKNIERQLNEIKTTQKEILKELKK